MGLSTPFLAAGSALLAAIFWGAGDFSGGMATRRWDAFRTVLIGYSIGLAALAVVAIGTGEVMPSGDDLVWGAISGILGMIGIGFLFKGFQMGRMGIVAPVSAVLATAIPVIFNMITEGLPSALQFVGFVLAMVGIWLLSRPERFSGRPEGLEMAVMAGLGFGGFFIALDQVSEAAVYWPLVSARLAAVVVLVVIALYRPKPIILREAPVRLLVMVGIFDVLGNLFFLLALQNGRLDITAVLGSLYPAVTAILARVTIKEELTRLQLVGVGAAVLAIVLITV